MICRKKLTACIALTVSVPVSAFATEPSLSASLETVVVTGHKAVELEREQALTPGSVTLIDGEDLSERNVSTLEDMLRYVPGVWTASGSAADSSFFSSRGSNLDATNYDGNGMKLLQDGLPVTTADGNNHNRIMDPLSARYLVVAHGANALTYGASTLGGAIDFITPTARDTQPELLINAGSNGQTQGRLTAGIVADRFDGLVTLDSKAADGYRKHQHQDRESLYANAGWQFSDAVESRVFVSYIDNNQELPGALTRDEFNNDPEQAQASAVTGNFLLNVDSWRVANKTTWDINANSSFSVGFSYEAQSLHHPIVDKVMRDFDGPGPAAPVEVFSLLINTDQKTAGTSLRYNLRLGDHDILAGLNYANTGVEGGNYRNDNGRRNGLTTRIDNQANSTEIFLLDRWQLAPQWTLVYGTQAITSSRDVRNTTVATNALYNPRGDYDSINPRVGIIYQPMKNIELFANASRLYEAPTNFELQDDEAPDQQALDAMHGTVLEIGTRAKHSLNSSDYWRWDLALYYAKLNDEILSVDSSTAPGTSSSSNVDATVHAGVEALLAGSFSMADDSHRIEPLLSITLNEFNFDNDKNYGDNQLPAAPDYALKGEILYRNSNGFFIGPTFDAVGKRYADFSNSYTIDSYTLLGLRTGFTQKMWEIYGEVRNLSDEKYVGVFSVKNNAAANAAILSPSEPRSVYAGIKVRF